MKYCLILILFLVSAALVNSQEVSFIVNGKVYNNGDIISEYPNTINYKLYDTLFFVSKGELVYSKGKRVLRQIKITDTTTTDRIEEVLLPAITEDSRIVFSIYELCNAGDCRKVNKYSVFYFDKVLTQSAGTGYDILYNKSILNVKEDISLKEFRTIEIVPELPEKVNVLWVRGSNVLSEQQIKSNDELQQFFLKELKSGDRIIIEISMDKIITIPIRD